LESSIASTYSSSRSLTKNKHLLRWVEKIAALTQPNSIHWVDGSPAEHEAFCAQLVAGGTFIKLNQELWPGCYYAKSDPSDVARVEDRTFICSLAKDNAGPTNNWVNPYEMRHKLKQLFAGCMRGRTMYVLPFSMGPLGSPMAQIGVQLTDSPYAVVIRSASTRCRARSPASTSSSPRPHPRTCCWKHRSWGM
jgi:phosphoenolpyruvate carboxykinase (GTP)